MRLLPFAVLAALAPGAASAADFSGTWKIDNLFNGSSSTITCTIVQAGDCADRKLQTGDSRNRRLEPDRRRGRLEREVGLRRGFQR